MRYGINRRFRLAHIGHADLRHRRGECPGHKLCVLFPAQTKGSQINQHMGGTGIGQRSMVITQQCSHMLAAGFTLGRIRQHDDMGNGQRRLHDLGGPGMNFVVQQNPLWVLRGQKG